MVEKCFQARIRTTDVMADGVSALLREQSRTNIADTHFSQILSDIWIRSVRYQIKISGVISESSHHDIKSKPGAISESVQYDIKSKAGMIPKLAQNDIKLKFDMISEST